MEQRETGQDGALTISGYDGDVPINNVSYDLDSDISDSQFMGNLHQTLAVTGVSYGGSFEHDGSNDELLDAVRDSKGRPKVCDQLTVKESERHVIFKHVIVESHSKDFPADDRTNESYDFVAEKCEIKERSLAADE